MPSKSQAQNRWAHAVANGDVPGTAKSVGRDFVKADEGRKVGDLPEHVKPKSRAEKRYGKREAK